MSIRQQRAFICVEILQLIARSVKHPRIECKSLHARHIRSLTAATSRLKHVAMPCLLPVFTFANAEATVSRSARRPQWQSFSIPKRECQSKYRTREIQVHSAVYTSTGAEAQRPGLWFRQQLLGAADTTKQCSGSRDRLRLNFSLVSERRSTTQRLHYLHAARFWTNAGQLMAGATSGTTDPTAGRV